MDTIVEPTIVHLYWQNEPRMLQGRGSVIAAPSQRDLALCVLDPKPGGEWRVLEFRTEDHRFEVRRPTIGPGSISDENEYVVRGALFGLDGVRRSSKYSRRDMEDNTPVGVEVTFSVQTRQGSVRFGSR